MAISKSYNKHNGKYYAYENDYVWDDVLQKKVQKRRCIGQYDPETNEIIPNAKRGRPSNSSKSDYKQNPTRNNANNSIPVEEIEGILSELKVISDEQNLLSLRIKNITKRLSSIFPSE